MLQGGNPGERGSVREYLMVRAQQRKNELEDMRLLLTIKAAGLDRSNADEVEKFNELMREYRNILEPGTAEQAKKSYEDKALILDSFKKDFRKNIQSGKFKNFQKVKPTWPTKQ